MNGNPVYDKNETKSAVVNTLTTDWFLNAFSCAHRGQSSFNAKTNRSISSGSGETVFAFDRNSLYSESENTLTNISRSSKTSSNSQSDNLGFAQISSLCSFSSYMQKEGVTSSNISKFNINYLVFDSFLKKENNTFVSTTSFIYTRPISLSFSNLPFFTIFPSSMHSSSVNSLCLSKSSSRSSNEEPCGKPQGIINHITTLLPKVTLWQATGNSQVKSLVSLNFIKSSTPFAKSGISTLNRLGIFITTSAIPITYNHIKHTYINTFPLKLLKPTLALLLRLKQFHESACSLHYAKKKCP